jgi:hypothetical protein
MTMTSAVRLLNALCRAAAEREKREAEEEQARLKAAAEARHADAVARAREKAAAEVARRAAALLSRRKEEEAAIKRELEAAAMTAIPDEYIAAGHPFYVLVVCDDSGKGRGEPIVWEHTFPAGVTLDCVMRQQQRIGSRYGRSYIAECKIIPASLRDPAQERFDLLPAAHEVEP